MFIFRIRNDSYAFLIWYVWIFCCVILIVVLNSLMIIGMWINVSTKKVFISLNFDFFFFHSLDKKSAQTFCWYEFWRAQLTVPERKKNRSHYDIHRRHFHRLLGADGIQIIDLFPSSRFQSLSFLFYSRQFQLVQTKFLQFSDCTFTVHKFLYRSFNLRFSNAKNSGWNFKALLQAMSSSIMLNKLATTWSLKIRVHQLVFLQLNVLFKLVRSYQKLRTYTEISQNILFWDKSTENKNITQCNKSKSF